MTQYSPTEQDIPVEDITAQDIPLESLNMFRKVRPEEVDNMYRGQAAALKSEIDEVDIFSAYTSMDMSEDPKATLNTLSMQRGEQEKKELHEYFNRNLGENAYEASRNVEAYQTILQQEEEDSHITERQVVKSMSGVAPDDNVMKIVEAEMALLSTIDDITQDYGFFEKALDFGKLLLPNTVIDNMQISGTVFGADTYVRDIIVGMKDLKRNQPDKFLEILPVLKDNLAQNISKGKVLSILSSIQSPGGELVAEDNFSDVDVVLDVADIAITGLGVGVAVAKMVQRSNAIRTAQRLGNTELAGDINTVALMDETDEVARTAGVSRDTVYNNSSPFDVSELDEAYASGLSSDTVNRINKVKLEQQKVSSLLNTPGGILKERVLTPTERLAAEDKFYNQMRTRGLDNINVINRTDSSTTFKYSVIDPDTGDVISDTQRMDLQVDDITGTWDMSSQNVISSYLASPTVFARNALPEVQQALRLDSTSSVVGSLFRKLQTEALSPILKQSTIKGMMPFTKSKRQKMAELDEVLMSGDQYVGSDGIKGKVYTPDELRGGVAGVRLDDAQIETYYNLRNLYDELFVIRNNETRRALVAQGKREIIVESGKPAVGKPYTREGATATINKEGRVSIYDSIDDEVIYLDGSDVGWLYDEGYVLSRLDSPHQPSSFPDNLFDLVLTQADEVKDLPEKVLHFKQGYVPKVNQGAYWFVKEPTTSIVNGRQVMGAKTIRMFSSRTEANKWLDSLDPEEVPAKSKYTLEPDRAREKQILPDAPNQGSGGGLYTGSRAKEEIPFGIDGLPAERLNTYEALGQNLQSLENFVSRNEWRLGMQKKWINSAKAAGFDRVDRFEKALIPDSDPRGTALRKMYDQIQLWSGFPSQGEKWYDGFVSGVMEWALNSRLVPLSDKTVVRGANYLRKPGNDPVSLVRNTAFHALLGVLNPAQLWVQAQGAAMALSLSNSPMRMYRMQNALAVATHAGTDAKSFEYMAKANGLGSPKDIRDLQELTRLWKRTGLESSILNTADHVMGSQGVGMTRDALRKVFDKGLLLYRMGELFNRRYSFLVAAERYRDKAGLANYKFNDKQLKEVLTDANNMMLNLSRANRASWQRGVISIPTQFLQVQAKFIESMLGLNGSFTMRERGRILVGQLALYGSAGIPLGNLGVRYLTEVLGMDQSDIDKMDPKTVKAVNEGIWGVFASNWLGADVELSSRGAIGSGMTQFTLDLMFSEATMGEKAIGAFGMVPHRAFQAWKTIKPMVLNESEAPLSKQEIYKGINAIASISSTWNNAQKGLFMHSMHMLKDSRGRIVSYEDFPSETEFMTMMGFQPSDLKELRDMESLVRSRKEYKDQVTTTLVNHYWDYVQILKTIEGDTERDKVIDRYNAGTKLIMASLNESERQKVRESLHDRLTNPSTQKEKAISQFIEEFSDNQVLGLGSLVESTRANGIIQTGTVLPDDDNN